MSTNNSSHSPFSSFPPFHLRDFSLQEKISVIIVGIVIIVVAVALFIPRGILKNPSSSQTQPQGGQPLTDQQKIQILKNSSGESSAPQQSDQEKIQVLQKLSQPQQNTVPQPSDAEKIKALKQLK